MHRPSFEEIINTLLYAPVVVSQADVETEFTESEKKELSRLKKMIAERKLNS